jgi:hypothetical protein
VKSAHPRDGWLVECVLDTGQRLHSDLFGEFDRRLAVDLAVDLLRRTMVSSVCIIRIGTGEVSLDQRSLAERVKTDLRPMVQVSAPRDRILLP